MWRLSPPLPWACNPLLVLEPFPYCGGDILVGVFVVKRKEPVLPLIGSWSVTDLLSLIVYGVNHSSRASLLDGWVLARTVVARTYPLRELAYLLPQILGQLLHLLDLFLNILRKSLHVCLCLNYQHAS